MPLPDASRLLDLSPETFAALGERFRSIGFVVDAVRPLLEVAPSPLRAWGLPMQVWQARRGAGLPQVALRVFTLGDPVGRDEAQEMLGDVPLDALVGAGLLRDDGAGKVVSPYILSFAGGEYILSDELAHGGDAVMGPAPTTQLLRGAVLPNARKLARALDLGCGAGTLAIELARTCEAVVATDVSARAVLFTKVNAMLAGLTNVDVRQGDLYAPVASETFDLVVSQPPFIGEPEGFAPAPYLYGGRRGDELAVRVLEGLPAHLSPRGRAVVLTKWPTAPGDLPLEGRVRKAVPDESLDVLTVLAHEPTLEEHCLSYAALHDPTLGEGYTRVALALRDHLAALGVVALRTVLHVFDRAPQSRRAFTSTLAARSRGEIVLTPAHIEKWLAARALPARGKQAVLDARVIVPAATTFSQEGEGGRIFARPSAESALEMVVINPATYELLANVGRLSTVREAAESLAAATGLAKEEAETRIVSGVTQGLMLGLLEPAADRL